MSKTVQILAIFLLFLSSFSLVQSNIKEDTPLIQAVKADNLKEVKRLLKSGVNVNQLGQDYKTALDVAIEHGYKNIVMSLIKYKGKITVRDNLDYLKSIIKSKIIRLENIIALIIPLALPLVFLIIPFGFIILFELTFDYGAGWIGAPVGFLVGAIAYASSISIIIPTRINYWNNEFEKNWMLPASDIN